MAAIKHPLVVSSKTNPGSQTRRLITTHDVLFTLRTSQLNFAPRAGACAQSLGGVHGDAADEMYAVLASGMHTQPPDTALGSPALNVKKQRPCSRKIRIWVCIVSSTVCLTCLSSSSGDRSSRCLSSQSDDPCTISITDRITYIVSRMQSNP